MKRIILNKNEDKRIRAGHPWVYDNEVQKIVSGFGNSEKPDTLEPGEIADVESSDKRYLGRALANPSSKIIARIYSPSKEGIDTGFFKRRIREALARRYSYDLNRQSCRIVFAEADFLPGLIIDRYTGFDADKVFQFYHYETPLTFDMLNEKLGEPSVYYCIQILSAGMEKRREQIINALSEIAGEDISYIEKKDIKVRELEGLKVGEPYVKGNIGKDGMIIFENNHPFIINLLEGQKTGHFLDQKENQRKLEEMIAQKFIKYGGEIKVLDAFCYTGGFTIAAFAGGAADVISADVSETALDTLRKNALLNGIKNCKTVKQDVFELLSDLERAKEKFDVIILDPPAFAKSHNALPDALRGYKEINLKAFKLLKNDGLLLSCSCSQALDEYHFKTMIKNAAQDAQRRIYCVDFCRQSPDHPVLIGYDESYYLKCGFYSVSGLNAPSPL
jgi:23S rRNA (cytosine1962-C5)-methyltransferase